MMKRFFAMLIFFMPVFVLAEEAAGEHEITIPYKTIFFQALNFGLFLLIIFVVARKAVARYFLDREEKFKQALLRAEAARINAEQQKRDIEQRLNLLEQSATENIEQARAEAKELKNKILHEAQDLSKNLRDEANRTAQVEIERAKGELREELLSQAMTMAKKVLNEKMVDQDQKRLQNEFVEKIQVVRP